MRTTVGRWVLRGALLAAAVGVASACQPNGATFVVDSLTDAVDVAPGDGLCATAGGECTLRAAVMEANALPLKDEIIVPAGTYALSLGGAGEDGSATGDLDVTEPVFLTGDDAEIDAGGADRVLDVHLSGGFSEIRGITFDDGAAADGAAVRLNTTDTTIVSFADVRFRGAVASAGSTVQVDDGIVGFVGATWDGNDATDAGGVAMDAGTLIVQNATIAGNSGAAIHVGAGAALDASYTTVASNDAAASIDVAGGGSAQLTASVVADPVGGVGCAGSTTSAGYNVEDGTSCGFTGTGDHQSADPGLLPAAGQLPALVPLADALVVDLVPVGVASCGSSVTEDVRGESRQQGSGCESGSVEWQPGETTTSACLSATYGPGEDLRHCDLRGVDLSGLDLSGADLEGARFDFSTDVTGVDASGADLSGLVDLDRAVGFESMVLTGADLSSTVIVGKDLSGADLAGIDLSGAAVQTTNLSSTTGWSSVTGLGTASLAGSSLVDVDLSGVDLSGCNLNGVELDGAALAGADLTGADVRSAVFGDATGLDAVVGLDGQNLRGTSFAGSDLSGADLSGSTFDFATDLTGAEASGADLSGIVGFDDPVGFESLTFAGADLSGVVVSGKDLTGKDVAGVNVAGASFQFTDLSLSTGWQTVSGLSTVDLLAAELAGVDLSGVDLTGALLSGVDLTGSDLTGVDIAGADVDDVTWIGTTGLTTMTGTADQDYGAGAFAGTDLSGLDLSGSTFRSAGFSSDFASAVMVGVDLRDADLGGATNMASADLTGALFSNTTCPDFSNSDANVPSTCLGHL